MMEDEGMKVVREILDSKDRMDPRENLECRGHLVPGVNGVKTEKQGHMEGRARLGTMRLTVRLVWTALKDPWERRGFRDLLAQLAPPVHL